MCFGVDAKARKPKPTATDAIKHFREVLNYLCRYVQTQGYNLRFALGFGSNAKRGDLYLPTVRHVLHFITTPDYPDMIRLNLEFAHETMAELNFVHAVAQAIEADTPRQDGPRMWSLTADGSA